MVEVTWTRELGSGVPRDNSPRISGRETAVFFMNAILGVISHIDVVDIRQLPNLNKGQEMSEGSGPAR